jgi:hypothetical protein
LGGTLTSALNEAPPVTLASAGTVAIGAAASNSITVTGTTTITAFDTIAAGALRHVTFSGALSLTYNATSMQLPGGANITTAAGDVAEMVSLGGGNWKCNAYERASGAALTGGGSFTGGTMTSAINEAPQVTLASAGTVNIGAASANSVAISGTTTITAFDTIASGAVRRLLFQGALTLTHSGTALILPGAASITTAAGDIAWMESLGSGNWRCVGYQKANGQAVSSAGGGLANITEALNTASPNGTNNVESLTVTGGSTTTFLALIPKGANGGILAAVPDSTSTGGNVRGVRAVDLQLTRGAATQVAGGQEAVCFGSRNTASGQSSYAIGDTNTASNTYSISFGFTNTASGFASITMGGRNNVADGNNAATLGGQYLSTKGIFGMAAFGAAGSAVASAGKRQSELYSLAAGTSDATATKMGTDGAAGSSANQVLLDNSSILMIEGVVCARQNTTGDGKGWTFQALVKRGANAAATALVGTPTVTSSWADSGASAWAVALVADTTNGALTVQVTGEAAKTIAWTCSAMAARVMN